MTTTPPPPRREVSYEEIEAAVMETARGRWFLAEYASRHRAADTKLVVEVIEKLEARLAGLAATPEPTPAATDGPALADLIAAARAEIAEMRLVGAPDDEPASFDADRMIADSETATAAVLRGAGRLQEIAWSLRENAPTERVGIRLGELAAEIYGACARHELTTRRLAVLADMLRAIDREETGPGSEKPAPEAPAPAETPRAAAAPSSASIQPATPARPASSAPAWRPASPARAEPDDPTEGMSEGEKIALFS